MALLPNLEPEAFAPPVCYHSRVAPRRMPSSPVPSRLPRAALQVALAAVSSGVAWWLAEGLPAPGAAAAWAGSWLALLPWLLAVRAATFWPFGLYSGLWRYAGMRELASIAAAVATGSAVFAVIAVGLRRFRPLPLVFYVIDALLLALLLGGVRIARRLLREGGRREDRRRVLVYGAGDAGEMILRDMQRRPDSPYEAVGILDDDPRKRGLQVRGVRVVGGRDQLARAMTQLAPDEVLVAMPSASLATLRQIVSALQPYKVPIKTLPSLRDLPECHVEIAQIRALSVDDLLTRPVVGLDPEPVRRLIEGRRVLVTGAGGSIGSELGRQILNWAPESLVMLERHENALFWLTNELVGLGRPGRLVPALVDITDAPAVDRLFAAERPHIVFHAAAHKHVPMLEDQVREAVRNNVFGTLALARAAERHGVERFVLISTDKAVHPVSVMGATKRACELIVQVLMRGSATRCCAVRFGNVLGSNGSVTQVFLRQIKAGGPVTVTDPDMKRYFMLISEAVELVQQAAAKAEPGTVYVLDMGEPVSIVDLARQLIRLAGYRPDADIPITFTGLRPGERLDERLVADDEQVDGGAKGVLTVTAAALPSPEDFGRALCELEALVRAGESRRIGEQLGAMTSVRTGLAPGR